MNNFFNEDDLKFFILGVAVCLFTVLVEVLAVSYKQEIENREIHEPSITYDRMNQEPSTAGIAEGVTEIYLIQ